MNRAARRIDWRVLGAAGLVATVLHAWGMIERGAFGGVESLPRELARAGLHLAMVGCVVGATLAADRATDRGTSPLLAYGSALLLGSAMAAGLQFAVHRWTTWPGDLGLAAQESLDPARLAKVFLDFLLWGATFVWVYAALREKWRAAARMQVLQVAHAEIRRRAMQTQLQALQARVEPKFLFDALREVRRRLDDQPKAAGEMLDDLVNYLRSALPRLRDSSSTLGQELELVAAYLAIRRETIATDVAPRLLGVEMAPMVLLPLVAGLCDGRAAGRGPIEIDVAADADSLRIGVTAPSGADAGLAELAREINERLATLHGARTSLTLTGSDAGRTRVVVLLPYRPSADAREGRPT
ncbi:MAG: histidine kinase [Ideonella sp.]|nr:histidine kinase [Ideonella sp.]MBP6776811.1 histidine kinase [Piscinibacter sp.]